MSKKVISILMSIIVAASLAGCKNATDSSTKKTDTTTESSTNSNDDSLEGKWAKNYTLDQTQKLFKDKLSKMENITRI